jgi:hypothetical protein
MQALWRGFAICLVMVSSSGSARSAVFPSDDQVADKLQTLAREHPDLLSVETFAVSDRDRPVWLCTLSTEHPAAAHRPAILLVAGIQANDLAGPAILLRWVEFLATNYSNNSNLQATLKNTVVFVVPRLNPDGAQSAFANPRMELETDLTPTDDDHDGLIDEDGPEDLDGNGLITSMRIRDAEGEYIEDPLEPRLLIKADPAKGERGIWRLLSEGMDNDHDDAWNEDGPGGVNFDRNFPFGYQQFAQASGPHPVSQNLTRKLADFMVEHSNIGLVFAYGQGDNLAHTPKAEPPKRPPTALHDADLPIYRELGKTWRDTLGLKKELEPSGVAGSFADWVYFNRGRLALAARPWSPALQIALTKSGEKKAEEKPADQQKPSPEKPQKNEDSTRNEQERTILKWLDQTAPGSFIPWQSIQHPDFTNQLVEIGGFAPFALSNPPESVFSSLAEKESEFLTGLLGRLPRIGIRKIETKHLGKSIFDITAQIENQGYLPTALAQGEVTREVLPTRVTLQTSPENILSGSKRVLLERINGSGGMKEVRWVMNATALKSVTIEVVSALGGAITNEIALPR